MKAEFCFGILGWVSRRGGAMGRGRFWAVVIVSGIGMSKRLWANPVGMTVERGTAVAVAQGAQLQVTVSDHAVLSWQSFNIASGETLRFVQPGASSWVWNQIRDAQPSQIFGRLEANGNVVLVNRAGFYFGPDSFVSAAGLIVSTATATPVESSAGLFWQFNGAPPQARIVNYGTIRAEDGGSLYLIADQIENRGVVSATGGTVGLFGGGEVRVSTRADGRGLSAAVEVGNGVVDNTGRIVADAGTITMNARVVNQGGVVSANTVRDGKGWIELVASESVALGAGSELSARGAGDGESNGGRVSIRSAGAYVDAVGSKVDVSGGAKGGDGGFVSISAEKMGRIRSKVVGEAQAGHRGGEFIVDPQDIILGNVGESGVSGGTVGAGDPPSGVLRLDVNSAFVGFSTITLQATRNITVAAGTVWDLEASTGRRDVGSLLKLEAGNNISVANGAGILAGENWSVSLQAGRDFSAGADAVKAGTGSIALGGSGFVEARNGNLSLLAGNQVTVAGGHIRTVAGGDIAVRAITGNIQAGTKANGFRFLPGGYQVDADLGGISTAAGGNVRLEAGLDVVSYLPFGGGTQTDAGSGAFGAERGDVIVQAGRDVSGHFVVRNGEGTIRAGRDAGTGARLLALSLVKGGWTVSAGRDLLLQEVRNPNGLFNNLGTSASSSRHRFDYSADAYASLTAGNSVQLRGTALPRYGDAFSQGMPPIYPGTLEVRAGAGGVVLGNDVLMFPSPQGNLRVTTTDGGSLVGAKSGDLAQWVMSDSGETQYRGFGDFGIADHAKEPVHGANSEAVRLDISGSMERILLGTPKRAEVRVGGNLVNSRFEGQHVGAGDVSLLHVGGDIINRNEFTSVPVATKPDFSAFELGFIFPPLSGALAGLERKFTYHEGTRSLIFQGRMTGDELQLLLNTPVMVVDGAGQPVMKPNGEPETRLVATLPPDVARKLYESSQDVPLNSDTGYRIGGGGTLDIRARNLDLGATAGIVSQGPRANEALAKRFDTGADIRVTLSGDLEMFSTRIASLNGGDITVIADGRVNVGSRTFVASDATARGIYTVDPSDVTVIARGNIDVNGSRIAAYDGGAVTVRSLEGNVDAGTGGSGSATVEKIVVDGQTRRVLSYAPTIPGSGILATSFPPSLDPAFPASENAVGNIVVETPRGDIVASAGGVVQIPLNGVGSNLGTVSLKAGTKDAAGGVLHKGNIDARGSGVIGSSVKLEATGDIQGLVFARQNIDLNAQQNVNVTALAQGNVSVGAGGAISGTIVGVGSVQASGATVDAALLSQNVTASGDVSSSQVGFAAGNAAGNASQSLANVDAARGVAAAEEKSEDDVRGVKPAKGPRLTRTVGRVTVVLPGGTGRN